MKQITKLVLKVIVVLFTTSGFTMFICEEVMQTAMFGAFAYKTAEDWQGLEYHVENYMIPAHETSKTIIYLIGWLNPIMMPAYVEYLKVNEGMIQAQQKLAWKKINERGYS